MKQPEGFAANGKEHLLCKLKKNIYDLKQSPHCWKWPYITSLSKWASVNPRVILAYMQMQEEICSLLVFMLIKSSLLKRMKREYKK